MDDASKVLKVLKELEKAEFTGVIRISYCEGGITGVEKQEDILKNFLPVAIPTKKLKLKSEGRQNKIPSDFSRNL
jgi:hypothetical protein